MHVQDSEVHAQNSAGIQLLGVTCTLAKKNACHTELQGMLNSKWYLPVLLFLVCGMLVRAVGTVLAACISEHGNESLGCAPEHLPST